MIPPKLHIKGEYKTPDILFDPESNQFHFEGSSFIEDIAFYDPVMHWLDSFVEEPNPEFVFQFKLVYINTLTSKVLFKIINKLQLMAEKGSHIAVEWYFDMYDEDIKDFGEELDRVSSLEFSHIENPS